MINAPEVGQMASGPSDRPDYPIPPLHAAVVAAVAGTGLAAAGVEGLAARLGRDVDALWEDLGVAAAAGLLERWPDHPDGPAVSLSPWSLARLGLRLDRNGERLESAGDPEPGERSRRALGLAEGVEDGEEADQLDEFPDPTAVEGLDALELAERAADWPRLQRIEAAQVREELEPAAGRWVAPARRDAREAERALVAAIMGGGPTAPCRDDPPLRAKLPRPATLLGLRVAWPILVGEEASRRRWTPDDGPCPGCGGRPKGLVELCLVCDQSGMDHLLGPIESWLMPGAGRRTRKSARIERRGRQLKGGVG